jgi:hypothetical protein
MVRTLDGMARRNAIIGFKHGNFQKVKKKCKSRNRTRSEFTSHVQQLVLRSGWAHAKMNKYF